MNMESRPVKTFQVHEHLRPHLGELYKSDTIFDKFEVSFSHDSQHIVTGSYQNTFRVLSVDGSKEDEVIEAKKNIGRRWEIAPLKPGSSHVVIYLLFWPGALICFRCAFFHRHDAKVPRSNGAGGMDADKEGSSFPAADINFTKRSLHAAFHPHEDSIAIAATSALYIFRA